MAGQRRRLLPVGSVVTCSGCGRPVMIAGRMATDESGRQRDYIGCPYPEGLLAGQANIFFDREDVERLWFVGCQSADEASLREALERDGADAYIGKGHGEGGEGWHGL